MIELTFDIETIPDQRPGALDAIMADTLANFKAPSGLTKEQAANDLGMTDKDEIKYTSKDAMIARWEKELAGIKSVEVAEAAWRKTALDGSRGEIAVIGWAFGDEPPNALHRDMESHDGERDLLREFFLDLKDHISMKGGSFRDVRFIGHNIEAFDLRFLFQRAVINGVKPPVSLTPSRYSDSLYDTMTVWAGWQNRISLDALCRALGIPSPKNGIDGSQVWDYVRDGKIIEVADYCAVDVTATREAYRRMTFYELRQAA